MDNEKQIRFLYPPLLLIGSLAFGAYLDNSFPHTDSIIELFSKVNIPITVIGAGSVILLLGFIIGTITIVLLRVICFRNDFKYEFWLSKKSYRIIGNLILKNETDTISKKDHLYAVTSFDHSFIRDEVQQWCSKRWNSFFVSANSAVALLLSLFVAILIDIKVFSVWGLGVILFGVLFTFNSWLSWHENMKMIEFQIRVKAKQQNES